MPPDIHSYPDDGFEAIPGRTLLFCLQPIGVGTPECEGLTSYMTRLAREHSLPLRRFVSRLLFRQTDAEPPLCDAKFFRQYAATINGLGTYAASFARTLNTATGRSDLELLTLLPWRGLLASNGNRITSQWRRWCPHCLRGQVLSGIGDVHWPLAWSMASVQECHRHRVQLANECHHCGRRQPVVPRLADLARCDHCRRPLFDLNEVAGMASMSGIAGATHLTVAEQLIAMNDSVEPAAVHRHWVDAVSARIAVMGCDRAALCRRVGLNPRAMNAWMNSGVGLSMDSLVKVLAGMEMSVVDVFGPGRGPRRQPRASADQVSEPARARHTHSIDVRAQAAVLLDEAATATEPPKLCEVATTLGTSTGYLRYWYPSKVALLRSRHLEIQRADRIARAERHHRAVESAVRELRAAGVFPGRKAVEVAVREHGASLIEPRTYAAYLLAFRSMRS